MGKGVSRALFVLLLSTEALAEERLGVMEFFVRGSGTYCLAAAPSVIALQDAMEGRAVVLEYPYDTFNKGRVDRFWAAYTGPSPYLPLVTVGSGFDVSQGPVDYATRYRQMLDAELARPPRAAIRAFSRRLGSGVQVFATVRNLDVATLGPDRQSTLWLIVWEDGPIGLTKTLVRGTISKALATSVPPGGTTNLTLESPSLGSVSWQNVRTLVLLEEFPPGGSRYAP